jgi:hypothetical protein
VCSSKHSYVALSVAAREVAGVACIDCLIVEPKQIKGLRSEKREGYNRQ